MYLNQQIILNRNDNNDKIRYYKNALTHWPLVSAGSSIVNFSPNPKTGSEIKKFNGCKEPPASNDTSFILISDTSSNYKINYIHYVVNFLTR